MLGAALAAVCAVPFPALAQDAPSGAGPHSLPPSAALPAPAPDAIPGYYDPNIGRFTPVGPQASSPRGQTIIKSGTVSIKPHFVFVAGDGDNYPTITCSANFDAEYVIKVLGEDTAYILINTWTAMPVQFDNKGNGGLLKIPFKYVEVTSRTEETALLPIQVYCYAINSATLDDDDAQDVIAFSEISSSNSGSIEATAEFAFP